MLEFGDRTGLLAGVTPYLTACWGRFGLHGAPPVLGSHNLRLSWRAELPPALAHEVLDKGVELAAAIDKFAGMAGIRDNQGAWGVLSNNLITRREAFRVALVAAFAPFYNAKLFRVARAAS